jgi:hypothetical protein
MVLREALAPPTAGWPNGPCQGGWLALRAGRDELEVRGEALTIDDMTARWPAQVKRQNRCTAIASMGERKRGAAVDVTRENDIRSGRKGLGVKGSHAATGLANRRHVACEGASIETDTSSRAWLADWKSGLGRRPPVRQDLWRSVESLLQQRPEKESPDACTRRARDHP